MPTLPSKADKIHKLAAQLQYNIDNWEAHRRDEDRAAVVAAAQTMKKYLDDIVAGLAAPSKWALARPTESEDATQENHTTNGKQCSRTCNQERLPADEGAAATASLQIDQSCGACNADALEGQEASV
jgi:hypothetical protein